MILYYEVFTQHQSDRFRIEGRPCAVGQSGLQLLGRYGAASIRVNPDKNQIKR